MNELLVNMADSPVENIDENSARTTRKCAEVSRIIVKEEIKARMKQISDILKKDINQQTVEDLSILEQSPEMVSVVQKRAKMRASCKERIQEVEDAPHVLKEKSIRLAEAVRHARQLVVYTGAGISTAASIPDYRGPNGVWTLLQKGQDIKAQDLSDAEPTLTHMSIAKLHQEGYVKHVVSQNCDGLHLRSGLPGSALSEVHGNMFIEVCSKCDPPREFTRLFDVTERTALRKHRTGRICYYCGEDLKDSIVHFGEKGVLKQPLNWQGAVDAAKFCDTILCLGSSLKVLRKYTCLWGNSKKPFRPELYIVNLQWTPKDDLATLKINGKCDVVMHLVMGYLGIPIPKYCREKDPLFYLATPLRSFELETTSKKQLVPPDNLFWPPDDPNVVCECPCNEAKCAKYALLQQNSSGSTYIPKSDSKEQNSLLKEDVISYERTLDDSLEVSSSDIDNLPEIICSNKENGGTLKKCDFDLPSSSDEIDKDDLSLRRPAPYPGWFGKGYNKKWLKKKR